MCCNKNKNDFPIDYHAHSWTYNWLGLRIEAWLYFPGNKPDGQERSLSWIDKAGNDKLAPGLVRREFHIFTHHKHPPWCI